MIYLNRYFLALILSFPLAGILFSGPLEDYEDFMKKRDALFDFSGLTDHRIIPNSDLASGVLDDFLEIKFSKDFQLRLNDTFFSDATSVGGSLNRLKDFLSKNKQWIKISGDWNSLRFATADEINKGEKLATPTQALNDDTFKAYCQAVGYSVDPTSGEIKSCQVNFKPLLDILTESLPGKVEFRRKKTLERFSRPPALDQKQSKAPELPEPAESGVSTSTDPEVVFPDLSEPSVDDLVDDSSIPSEPAIDSPSEVVRPPEEIKPPDPAEILPEPKDPNPLMKTDLLKSKSSNLILKIGLPIGAGAFLLIGFGDKIKEYFSKKSLNKSKKLKQKIESERVKVLCSLAALACVGGTIFVFTR